MPRKGSGKKQKQANQPKRRRQKNSRVNKPMGTVPGRLDSAAINKICAQSGFLKCALAAQDFNDIGESFEGIQDQYGGQVLSYNYNMTQQVTVAGGTTIYVALMPNIGVAWYTSTALTNTRFAPTVFPQFKSFSPDSGELTFSKARLAGKVLQCTNVTPILSRGGSVLSIEPQIVVATSLQSATVIQVEKLAGNPAELVNNVRVGDVGKGFTCILVNKENKWLWKDATPGIQYTSSGADVTLTMDNGMFISNPGNVPGFVTRVFDNEFSSQLVQFTALPGSPQTLQFRAIECVELIVDSDSPFFPFTHVSPPHNPVVMAMYAELVKRIPRSMTRADNEALWKLILQAIRDISYTVAGMPFIPAPYRGVAGTVGMIAGGLSGLNI